MKGESGEFGAFQFLGPTWICVSKQVTGKVIPQLKDNEEYVAVMTIQRLLNDGHTEKEIGLIWNSSLCGSEKPLVKKGVNKFGVKYDTMEYTLKVMRAYASN